MAKCRDIYRSSHGCYMHYGFPKNTSHGVPHAENPQKTSPIFTAPWIRPQVTGAEYRIIRENLLGPLKVSWLVVSTHLKNISQIGNLPQIGVKIKHNWNHQPIRILSLPETNSSPPQMDGWNTIFLFYQLGRPRPMFRGKIVSFKEGKTYVVFAQKQKNIIILNNIILNINLVDNKNLWFSKNSDQFSWIQVPSCISTGAFV